MLERTASAVAVMASLLTSGLAAAIQTAPIATSDPTIQSDPSPPCNTLDNPGSSPLAGNTQGPFAQRLQNDSAVNGSFTLTCNRNVKVKVLYTIYETFGSGGQTVVGSGAAIVSVMPKPGNPACTFGSPCTTDPIFTNKFKVGGALTGQRQFAIGATAEVYEPGTVFFGDYPLGAQPVQVANLSGSSATL